MLLAEEINEVQGLLHYLMNLKHLRPEDIVLIGDHGEPAAVVGLSEDGSTYVLKKVY